MTALQMKVWTRRGSCVERVEPDTPMNRHLLDKAAFARMADPKVSSVLVERVERPERIRGAGTYR